VRHAVLPAGLAFAGHDKQRVHLEAVEIRAQALGVVILVNIDYFLRAGHHVNGHIIVATIAQHYQPSVDALQDQVESQVAVGHWHNRIDGIRVAAAHQVAQFLVDGVDRLAVVKLG